MDGRPNQLLIAALESPASLRSVPLSAVNGLLRSGVIDPDDLVKAVDGDGVEALWRVFPHLIPADWRRARSDADHAVKDLLSSVSSGGISRSDFLSRRLRLCGPVLLPDETSHGVTIQRPSHPGESGAAPAFSTVLRGPQPHVPESDFEREFARVWPTSTYRFERMLGAGGGGEVFLAMQPIVEQLVAMKRIRAEFVAHRNEVKALLQIGRDRAENVVFLQHFEDRGGFFWLIFEYLEGENLADLIDRTSDRRSLAPDEIMAIVTGVAAGLDAIHRHRIVHRDLKPANIMLTARAGERRLIPKIIDFGLAHGHKESGATILGWTPGYQAPELAKRERLTPAYDVYAFGMILYQICVGRLPSLARSDAVSISEARPDLPAGLDELYDACTRYSPADRIPDGSALVARLRAVETLPPKRQTAAAGGNAPASHPSPGSDRGGLWLRCQEYARLGQVEAGYELLRKHEEVDREQALLWAVDLAQLEIKRLQGERPGTRSTRDENICHRALAQLISIDAAKHAPPYFAFVSLFPSADRCAAALRELTAAGHSDLLPPSSVRGFLRRAVDCLWVAEPSRSRDRELRVALGLLVDHPKLSESNAHLGDDLVRLGQCLLRGRGGSKDASAARVRLLDPRANASGSGAIEIALAARTDPGLGVAAADWSRAAMVARSSGGDAGLREHALWSLLNPAAPGSDARTAITALLDVTERGDKTARDQLASLLKLNQLPPFSRSQFERAQALMPTASSAWVRVDTARERSSHHDALPGSAPALRSPRDGSSGSASAAAWNAALAVAVRLTQSSGAQEYEGCIRCLKSLALAGNLCADLFLNEEVVAIGLGEGISRALGFESVAGRSAGVLEQVIMGTSGPPSIDRVALPRIEGRIFLRLSWLSKNIPGDAVAPFRSELAWAVGACHHCGLGTKRDGRAAWGDYRRAWAVHRTQRIAMSLLYCLERGIGSSEFHAPALEAEVRAYVQSNRS